ncbi:nucleoside/nucleotide kinase family protein [Phytohalomonas tamaricis]|uniref:nucleoside/nucleotide kinase family protein n=1 Tax=Phytohalomonas tamaricis TaxID=2081032 RepID=UPI0021D44A13|nr:nucleoside/nucleotide kinase family protein [Phytohalomonas tamaricis]
MLAAELIEQARKLMNGDSRQMLGIVGPPGAGKSTLAEALVDALGPQAQIVPMDGFHLSNRELKRLGRAERKGAPDTFDAFGYRALLKRLRSAGQNETVYAPGFYRDIEEPIAASIAIEPHVKLVVTEGNYLLLDREPWANIAALLDEVWYLDVDEALRHERLLARHVRFGRTSEQATEWIRLTDQPNAELIASGRDRAGCQLRWGSECFSIAAPEGEQ